MYFDKFILSWALFIALGIAVLILIIALSIVCKKEE